MAAVAGPLLREQAQVQVQGQLWEALSPVRNSVCGQAKMDALKVGGEETG